MRVVKDVAVAVSHHGAGEVSFHVGFSCRLGDFYRLWTAVDGGVDVLSANSVRDSRGPQEPVRIPQIGPAVAYNVSWALTMALKLAGEPKFTPPIGVRTPSPALEIGAWTARPICSLRK